MLDVTLLESLPQTFVGMRTGVSFALVKQWPLALGLAGGWALLGGGFLRVLLGVFAKRQIRDETAFIVEFEEMPNTCANVAVKAALRLHEPLGWLRDFDGGDVKDLADFHHSLWVMRVEVYWQRGHQMPLRRARQLLYSFADDAALREGCGE